MSLTWPAFLQQRIPNTLQFFPAPGATRTVMVCSHIWWTEQIAFAFLNSGLNVLLHPPLYLLYTSDETFQKFDEHWDTIIATMRRANVEILLGGNTSAMAVHPRTGEMIHDAAGVDKKIRLINWWWDEPRARPPLANAGISPQQYIDLLANPNTTNAIWDLDVKEELEAEFGLQNLLHLPLATLLEYWPDAYIPMERRPLTACFLGNCHFTAEWIETDTDPLMEWARQVLALKIADPARPMQSCIDQIRAASPPDANPPPSPTNPWRSPAPNAIAQSSKRFTGDPWIDFQRPSEFLNGGWMHFTRNKMLLAAENLLKGKLALIGKGWDKLGGGGGLRANMEYAGDKSGHIYAQSQISLNLFGGCVHGGMPLRPYDIAASGGLILTHVQRELPELFEPGKECLSFRTEAELISQIKRIRALPPQSSTPSPKPAAAACKPSTPGAIAFKPCCARWLSLLLL